MTTSLVSPYIKFILNSVHNWINSYLQCINVHCSSMELLHAKSSATATTPEKNKLNKLYNKRAEYTVQFALQFMWIINKYNKYTTNSIYMSWKWTRANNVNNKNRNEYISKMDQQTEINPILSNNTLQPLRMAK